MSMATEAGAVQAGAVQAGAVQAGAVQAAAIDGASLAASLFAIDPAGAGVCIRSPVHPARDQWLQMLRALLPAEAPVRRIPSNIADGRLLGGLDLTATIQAGRPVAERGVLAAADGGVVVVSMAERLTLHTAACINSVIDAGEVVSHREGVFIRSPARIGIVALDEGMSDEESMPAALLDRLGFLIDFGGLSTRAILTPLHDREEIRAARRLLPDVRCDPRTLELICATAMALGVESTRTAMLAMRVARAAAALDGRVDLCEDDAILAGRLVLAPRATLLPAAPADPPPEPPRSDPPQTPPEDSPSAEDSQSGNSGESTAAGRDLQERDLEELTDVVLAAARAAIPDGLLARLNASAGRRLSQPMQSGRFGALRNAGARGRPFGTRSGKPRGDARLNVIETLRAAAPWQKLRGRTGGEGARIQIGLEDFRVTRYRQRARTLTIFAVDASGSSALHRLAEAKGAVELLLAECYIRRDQVAVIAFRGRAADLLLPPTRSLVRAKRSLAEMAGGGGTPLAAALDTAWKVADQALRRGETPTIVMLTDGRANVLRDGTGGREAAQAEALRVAAALRAAQISALFVDTSPRPNPLARDLAQRMNAQYIPLPFADARALSNIVQASRAG
jgi:magnesium chelatase subunit D